jgi:hypothetical protein
MDRGTSGYLTYTSSGIGSAYLCILMQTQSDPYNFIDMTIDEVKN